MLVEKRLTVDVGYVAASDNTEIVAELWAKDILLGQGQSTVNAGFDTTSVTINLRSRPPEGADYEMRTGIRPHDADQGNYVDFCMRDFVVGDNKLP